MSMKLEEILEKGQRVLFLLFPMCIILNLKKEISILTILLVLISFGNIYRNKKVIITFYEKFLLLFIASLLISIVFQNVKLDVGITHLKKHLRWLLYPTFIGQLIIKREDIKFTFISIMLGIFGEIVRLSNELFLVKSWYNISFKEFMLSPIPWNYRYFGKYDIPQTAMILGAVFIMFYYLFNIINNKKEKIYIGLLLFLDIILLLSVQSRGMSLSLFVVILVLGVLGKERIFKIFSISIIFLCLLLSIYFSNSHYIKRYENVTKDGSFYARVEVYKEAFRLFKNNPITGIGFDNFVFLQNNKNYKYNESYGHPHNMPLKMLSETGIIGFVSYYLFMISILWNFWKEAKKNRYSLVGFLVILTLLLYENIETMMISRIGLRYVFLIVAICLNNIYQKVNKLK